MPLSESDVPSPGLPFAGLARTGLGGLPATLAPADDSDRPVANLAHILAHRMRGPLTSIQCYTDLLADELGSPDQREMALRIFESAFALEGMLADLQRFTLTLSPVLHPVHPAELVAGLLAGLGEEASAVDVDLEDGASAIQADGMLLRQALLILLRNALEAEAEAGGSAGSDDATPAPSARPGVRVTLRDEADELCFDVWNAGTLAEGHRVFEPFFTTKSSNLGIGLCIARRIAEAHDGDLTFSLGPDDGITFTLRIPKGVELPPAPVTL